MSSPTTLKGNIGQAAVALAAIERGYGVSYTIEGLPYDLVIDRGGALARVQVKYASKKPNGTIRVEFDSSRSISGRKKSVYTSDTVDALVAYEPESKQMLWIDSKFFTQGVVSFRVAPSKNNQTKGVVWAKDFLEW